MDSIKAWLESFLKAFVKHPEEVSVEQTEGFKTVVLSISVAEADVGMVKGRRARMISALSKVAGLCGTASRKRYVVKVLD